jgi:hypothetical protein
MRTNYRALLVLSSVFVCASLLSQSARAEYYLVYPEPAMMVYTTVSCDSPCMKYKCKPVYYRYESCAGGPTHYMEFHSRRAGASYGEEERAPYAWIP